MDRYDPNQWTTPFVRENRDFCLSFLQETNTKVMDCLFQNNYEAAIAGLDRMLNGAIVMQNAGVADMKPFLSANSFYEGAIILCGLKNVPENQRMKTAFSAFLDARDFASVDTKQTYIKVIDMIESGREINSIANNICPNFPNDIIKEMLGTNSNLQKQKHCSSSLFSVNNSADSNQSPIKKKWIGIAIAITIVSIIALALISNFVNNKNNDITRTSVEKEAESEEYYQENAEEMEGEMYFATSVSGLNLRSEKTQQSQTLLLIPYKADVEVFEISDGWAYVRYNNEYGYCSSDYLSKGDKESYVSEDEWKNAYLEYVRRRNSQSSFDDEFLSCSLIYIDDDDIPELYLEGSCEAVGVTICTYSKGVVQDLHLLRLYGSRYIPNTGLIKNSNGNMGTYQDVVYKLENGTFDLLLEGKRLDDPLGTGEEPEFIIGNENLDEYEYENRFNLLFDLNNAIHLVQGSMTYDQLINYLSN